MNILSIDSSSKVATVAILNDTDLLGEYVLNNKREHSIVLMPMIEDLLKDCNLTIDDIDGYVVSKGPGSFTGLRIGMATVKGLSFGSGKPYVSISSLDALAYSLNSFDGLICPIMDALRDNVYTAVYSYINSGLVPILEPTSMNIDELANFINSQDSPVIFTGDAVHKHKDFILSNIPHAIFAPNHLSIIRASSIGELGLNLLKNNIHDDPNSAPVYLKKPQAERELERRLSLNESNS